jgi:hypothetical protein
MTGLEELNQILKKSKFIPDDKKKEIKYEKSKEAAELQFIKDLLNGKIK